MSWKCCDVKNAEVLVSSTGSIRNDNYCCPKGSIVYDALSTKCLMTCPENASTDVVEGNQMGNSVCYCNEGFKWNSETGGCEKVNTCADGQVSVTNYDSAGNNIGTTCCEVKEDYTATHDEGAGTTGTLSKKGYTVTGAINGTCCGGYAIEDYYYTDTATGSTTCNPDLNLHSGCLSLSYQVFVNGGKAYCGQSVTAWKELEHTTVNLYKRYISSSKVCRTVGEPIPMCTCSTSGDPANGSSCDP